MPRLFFQVVHLPGLTRERNEYFMWTLFYQKETEPPKTDKKEDTKEHTWNDEKEQWYCTTSDLSSQVLIHVVRYIQIRKKNLCPDTCVAM